MDEAKRREHIGALLNNIEMQIAQKEVKAGWEREVVKSEKDKDVASKISVAIDALDTEVKKLYEYRDYILKCLG